MLEEFEKMKYLAIALVLLALAAPASACPPVFVGDSAPVAVFQQAPVVFFQAAPVAAFTPVFPRPVVIRQQVFVPTAVQINVRSPFRTPLRNLIFGR
jgi:hypothetical protein